MTVSIVRVPCLATWQTLRILDFKIDSCEATPGQRLAIHRYNA